MDTSRLIKKSIYIFIRNIAFNCHAQMFACLKIVLLDQKKKMVKKRKKETGYDLTFKALCNFAPL